MTYHRKHRSDRTSGVVATALGLLALSGVSSQAAEPTRPAMHERLALDTQSPPGAIGADWPQPVEDSQWFGSLLVDQLEYRLKNGDDTLRWDATGWYGGDRNRVWLKTEGEWRTAGQRGGEAEAQGLYGRLIAPFWDVQVGVRYDRVVRGDADRGRGFAVIGLQGLAPYWFEVEPAVFISQDGDVSARLTTSYELLFTQRLILQTRLDVDAAAQAAEKFGVGEGLNSIGVGLRLRYEASREVAPYIGVLSLSQLGETADISRSEGARAQQYAAVMGIRLWF